MSKKFVHTVVRMTGILLILLALITIVIDPYFHYHKPIKGLSYTLNIDTQRYQNDGILRHFDYDALITGTSLTENFKTTELEELFAVTAVKTPCSGASYKEIDAMISTALSTHEVKMVVRSLDYNMLAQEKDESYETSEEYPAYLIDRNLFNDVNYIFNKDVLLSTDVSVILGTIKGRASTSFDEYSNWDTTSGYGKDVVLLTYQRPEKEKVNSVAFTEADERMVRGNVVQNVVANAKKYPNTQFYYFFPPYSICYWDQIVREGRLDYMMQAERIAIETMLECSNIHLFSYADAYEVTTNLDYYKDYIHYSGEINSMILQTMQAGKYALTADNYQEYQSTMYQYYQNYDYDAIFE